MKTWAAFSFFIPVNTFNTVKCDQIELYPIAYSNPSFWFNHSPSSSFLEWFSRVFIPFFYSWCMYYLSQRSNQFPYNIWTVPLETYDEGPTFSEFNQFDPRTRVNTPWRQFTELKRLLSMSLTEISYHRQLHTGTRKMNWVFKSFSTIKFGWNFHWLHLVWS